MNDQPSPFTELLPPHDPGALTIVRHGEGFRLFHKGDVEFCRSAALLLLAVTRWRRAEEAAKSKASETEAAS